MKSLELSMIISAIIIIAVMVSFTISLEQKSKIVEQPQSLVSKYGVDAEDLITRPININIRFVPEQMSTQTCFHLNDNSIDDFPNLKKDLFEINKESSQLSSSQRILTMANDMNVDEALHLIEKYPFNMTKIVSSKNEKHIIDNSYNFQCNFDYNGNQYFVKIFFESYFPDQSGFVNVNFTKDNEGNKIITSPRISMINGINNTIIFNNQLENDIILSITGPDFWGSNNVMTVDHKIPSGKPFPFLSLPVSGSNVTYSVKEYNLNGTILSKQLPPCLSEMEDASIYSTLGLKPMFPSYLPNGMNYKCLRYANPDMIYQFSNTEIDPKFMPISNNLGDNFFENGGVEIHYSVDNYLLNGFSNYDLPKINYSHPCYYSNLCTTMKINGNTAILDNTFYTKRISWDTGKELYQIFGNYSIEELIKIAKSMKN